MDDKLVQRMKDDRGALADILKKIPLLKEYVENRTLWEADRTIRDAIGRRLEGVKDPVRDLVREASKDIRAGERLAELESLLTQIDTVANTVRFADYGHSGLTANIKIKPADLERLVVSDRDLLSRLDEVEGAARAAGGGDPGALKAALKDFEKQFARRKECLVEAAEAGEKEE